MLERRSDETINYGPNDARSESMKEKVSKTTDGRSSDPENLSYLHEEIKSANVLLHDALLSQDMLGMPLNEQVVHLLGLIGSPQSDEDLHRALKHRFGFGRSPLQEIQRTCRNDDRITKTAQVEYGLGVWRIDTSDHVECAIQVETLLRRIQRPIHYRDIYAYLARQVVAGGKDPAKSLLARFSDNPCFAKYGNGNYGLVEWGLTVEAA